MASVVTDFDLHCIWIKGIKTYGRVYSVCNSRFLITIDESGLDISKEDPFRVGVLVGSGIGGNTNFAEQATL